MVVAHAIWRGPGLVLEAVDDDWLAVSTGDAIGLPAGEAFPQHGWAHDVMRLVLTDGRPRLVRLPEGYEMVIVRLDAAHVGTASYGDGRPFRSHAGRLLAALPS